MDINTNQADKNADISDVPDNSHLVGPVKHKPFTLPKHYIRKQQESSEILDNLEEDTPTVFILSGKRHDTTDDVSNVASSSTTFTAILEPTEKVQKERRKYTRKQHKTPVEQEKTEIVVEEQQEEVKKERKPTAYNVFVKETLASLAESHKEMSAKDRFALAIQKWNEHKTA